MPEGDPRHLLADIGGTNARYALAGGGQPFVVSTTEHPDFASGLDAFRQSVGLRTPFAKAVICAAGPVSEQGVRFTNCDWHVDVPGLRKAIGGGDVILVNDFTALAHALPALGTDDLMAVGSWRHNHAPLPGGDVRGVLGPGTGLGVSGLLADGRGGYVAIGGEGGHVDLAPCSEFEDAVLGRLRARFGHVSVERVLSGPGLSTLYQVLSQLGGACAPEPVPAPEDIVLRARGGEDAVAVQTMVQFTEWLGAAAGDLALTLGAKGGIYLTGNILNGWGPHFDLARFRARFQAKGRHSHYLADVPTWLVTDRFAAFKGLARLL